jgi:hypothetical protein
MRARPSSLLYGLAACAALWSLDAPAQVMRCTDPRTGQVTYTDGRCAGGAQAHEVEPRKTPEEIRAEREQAAEALARKHERQQAEAAEQRREEARQRAARPAGTAQQPDYAHSAACARSRRAVDEARSHSDTSTVDDQVRVQALQRQMNLDCLGPQRSAEIEAAAPVQPVPTSPVFVVPHRLPPVVTPPQPPAAPIVGCNVFRCWDGNGTKYPR